MKMTRIVIAVLLFVVLPVMATATINNQPIAKAVAVISPAEFYACECEGVELDGSGSYDLSGGRIVKYEWLHDKKVIARGMKVALGETFTHNPGTYTFTLKVTDDGGATDTAEVIFRVKYNPYPQIEKIDWEIEDNYYDDDDRNFLVLGDKFIVEVDLLDKNIDHGRIIYNWDYPAEVFRKIGVRQTRNGEKEEITFEVISNGIRWKTSYEIGITVSNVCGEGGVRKYIELEIESSQCNSPPEAEITFLSAIKEGENFHVSSAGSTTGRDRNESNDEIVACYWNITDELGETAVRPSFQEDPRFRIEDSGIYIISLKVTDRFGATGETRVPFKVEEYENDPPVADASETKQTAIHGESFKLDGSCSWDPDEIMGGKEHSIGQYVWRDETYNEELCRSKNPVCSIMLNRTGQHKIVLEVRDTGDRVEKGDDEIEVLSDRDEIEITVIAPPEPAPTATSAPRIIPKPTPAPIATSMPTLEKIPAPTKNFLGNIREIWENIIKTLF